MQREVSFYQAVDHPNVIRLIAHEVRLHRGHLRAYLVFPYYQVSCRSAVSVVCMHPWICGHRKAPLKT